MVNKFVTIRDIISKPGRWDTHEVQGEIENLLYQAGSLRVIKKSNQQRFAFEVLVGHIGVRYLNIENSMGNLSYRLPGLIIFLRIWSAKNIEAG